MTELITGLDDGDDSDDKWEVIVVLSMIGRSMNNNDFVYIVYC